MKYFLKNYWAMKYLGLCLLGYETFFEKFVKPSGSSSHMLNVCSLRSKLLNSLEVIDTNLLKFSEEQLTKVLLYGCLNLIKTKMEIF